VLVTREADYAVRCVIEVARIGRTSAAQVAHAQAISPTFLGKIVQSLAKAGILATRRGVGGGISLARPAEQITLLQVIEAVGGPLCINECLQTPPQCTRAGECPAYPYLVEAQHQLRESLDVSISRLLKQADTAANDQAVGEGAPTFAPAIVASEDLSENGHRNDKGRRARTADPAARGGA
jgi:Rrf2 family protein